MRRWSSSVAMLICSALHLTSCSAASALSIMLLMAPVESMASIRICSWVHLEGARAAVSIKGLLTHGADVFDAAIEAGDARDADGYAAELLDAVGGRARHEFGQLGEKVERPAGRAASALLKDGRGGLQRVERTGLREGAVEHQMADVVEAQLAAGVQLDVLEQHDAARPHLAQLLCQRSRRRTGEINHGAAVA